MKEAAEEAAPQFTPNIQMLFWLLGFACTFHADL